MKAKKLFLLAGVAIVVTACSEDSLESVQPKLRNVSLSASVEGNTTRASFDESGKLAWSENDAVWVETNKGGSLFSLTDGSGEASGIFSGGLISGETLGSVAIYPYNESHSVSNGIVKVYLPDEYKNVADFENTNAIMMASIESNSLAFMHLGGMLRFKISNFPQGATKAILTTGNSIAGEFTVTKSDGKNIITSVASSENNSVALSFAATTKVEAKNITFPIPTGSYKGVTLEIKDAAGKVLAQYKNPTKQYTVERAMRYNASVTFANIDAGNGENTIYAESIGNQLQTALDAVGTEATIDLAAGTYDKATLFADVVAPTSVVGVSPYTFERNIDKLTLTGVKDAKLAGFDVLCSYGVRYSTDEYFNSNLAIAAHPSYYNINLSYKIGTLTFKNITITDVVALSDASTDDNNISIETLVFDGVTFDFDGKTVDAGIHIVSENADVNNVIIKNCKFVNCSGVKKPIAFDARTADDVNITIENNTFDSFAYNAMQLSGEGSNFTGTILIKDNAISNTEIKDRGVRISNVSGNLTISGNTLNMYASDTDGEAMKWGGEPTLTFTSNTFDGKSLVVDGVVAVVGEVLASGVQLVKGVYQILNADGLFWVAKQVNADGNNFANKVIKLNADIDLKNAAWTPIGLATGYAPEFAGSFDGNNKTISNLTVVGARKNAATEYVSGLFGYVTTEHVTTKGYIKNLTINGANVSSTHYAGVVAAWVQGAFTIENCTVKNAVVKSVAEETSPGVWDNGDKVGGIAGYIAQTNTTIKGCTVSVSSITGYRDIGGILGYANENTFVTNNQLGVNVTVTVDNAYNYKNYTNSDEYHANDIIGEANAATTVSGNTGTATVNRPQ